MKPELNDDNFDDAVDVEIAECLSLEKPTSFFVFAGAGSGKTRSLVAAINHVINYENGKYTRYFSLHAKHVGVITYTNAATQEILKRTRFNPVVKVSTIHRFAWELIDGFNEDIRDWLAKKLEEDLHKLSEEQERARSPSNKTSLDRARRIESKKERLAQLGRIKKFTYNPDGENSEHDSLAHSEVIGITAELLATNETMQKILVLRFPFLLVDESQDTNAKLMEAFMEVQRKYRESFALGLFGDTMQRIYNDGLQTLGQNIPGDWRKPIKRMNHRSPSRIIDLVNKVRMTTDRQQQCARKDRGVGIVRLFVTSSHGANRLAIESEVAGRMMEITSDQAWIDQLGVKRLILEHHMASTRMGFDEMFKPLYNVEKLKTGLLDGTLPEIRFFANCLLPIISGDEGRTISALRVSSPLLSRKILQRDEDLRLNAINRCQEAVVRIASLTNDHEDPTFGQVLKVVAETNLFSIPPSLHFFSDKANGKDSSPEEVEVDEIGKEDRSKLLETQQAWEDFLRAPFSQLKPYLDYITGSGGFDTHQGVKGLEFPRVMVIMDDSSARGWQFSYDRLFGAVGPSVKGKPSADPDKTKRLFYVTCSRAEKALALIAYSENPDAVCKNVINNGWFSKEEIILL
jgi:DNA helicase II / ATP-dependent DNA helicase PcrA